MEVAIQPLESVRITARQGGQFSFGGGDSSHPVGLRSCAYPALQNTPYEWFVKFNVSELKQTDLANVLISVSKCKSSQSCVAACTAANSCSCDSANDGQRSCGGSNIESPYDATSDDLHLWHVSNGWSSNWAYPDYKHSWAVTWNTCDQVTLKSDEDALDFASHVGSINEVGEHGTATFNVTELVHEAANNGNGLV